MSQPTNNPTPLSQASGFLLNLPSLDTLAGDRRVAHFRALSGGDSNGVEPTDMGGGFTPSLLSMQQVYPLFLGLGI